MKKNRQSFDEYYGDLWQDRWPLLKEAMENDPAYRRLSEGLVKPYYLDDASYLAAAALGVCPGERVLDMCAAPGGKTLVLATGLRGSGLLVANDRSATRRDRLRRVLSEHLSETHRRIITITGHDASRWGLHESNVYDKVLVDVPCSSERHVLGSSRHLADWSPSRTKRLGTQAFAILAAALEAARPDGVILYCTCALSALENDGVIDKLHAKRSGAWSLMPVQCEYGEKTRYGVHILPDRDEGRGPLFMAKIRKSSGNDAEIRCMVPP